MAMVNPNESGGGGARASKGRKVLAAVGCDYGTSRPGNRKIDVHWIVVKDLDAPKESQGELGYHHWDTFTLLDSTRWRLGMCAKALGRTAPFDDEDEQAVAEILTGGYVVATIADKPKFNSPGEFVTESKRFDPWTGGEGEDWPEMIGKAEDAHLEMRERQRQQGSGARTPPARPASQQRPQSSDDPIDGAGLPMDDDGVPF